MIGVDFLDPRSIFDQVMRDQRLNFCKVYNFSTLHAHISKTANCSDIKLSSACSSFISEQNGVLFQFIDGIFVMHSIPKGNSVTFWGEVTPRNSDFYRMFSENL